MKPFTQALIFLILLSNTTTSARDNALPPFDEKKVPPAPDYSLEKNWAALPFREDEADLIPSSEIRVHDSLKVADVFYVYPTLYTRGNNWNADVNDERLNKRIDSKPIRYQASVFNASCRVYAPRYRQSIVDVFFKDSLADSEKALELAYSDVKRAFEYYLKNYNNGRPIIIAGHSQGAWHTRRLIKEYFDHTALSSQLVAAYIIGFHIREDMYQSLKFCRSAGETGCFVSWMSYRAGHTPKWKIVKGTEGINPLLWSDDRKMADASMSKGAVLLNIDKPRIGKTSAQLTQRAGGTILEIKTRLPIARRMRNLHILDFNLFWYDIRENVSLRIREYLKQQR